MAKGLVSEAATRDWARLTLIAYEGVRVSSHEAPAHLSIRFVRSAEKTKTLEDGLEE